MYMDDVVCRTFDTALVDMEEELQLLQMLSSSFTIVAFLCGNK